MQQIKRGLTLVELVLVLAIVGLVALLAFTGSAPEPHHTADPTQLRVIRDLGSTSVVDGAGVTGDVQSNPPGTSQFYAADVTVPGFANRIDVTIATSVGSTFLVKRGASGTYIALNSGAALTADAEYRWSLTVTPGELVNFKLGTSGTLRVFRVVAKGL